MSCIAYQWIVKDHSSQTRFLVGYGVIIPAILYLPFPVVELFDIRSLALRLGLIAAPLTVSLKCLESMHGFAPETATRSLKDYMRHFAFIVYPLIDSKTQSHVPTTLASVRKGIGLYLKHSLISGVLYSFLMPYDFAPFPSLRADTEIFIATDVNQLLNNFIAAAMVSFSLVFSMNGVSAIVQLLGGFQAQEAVNNPMFASKSPSDFWGVRWNNIIHRGLKQGVFKPVMSATGGSRNAATMAAFLASGLAHEYVWVVMFFANSHEIVDSNKPALPPFGKSMLFFGWNGILLLVEHAIGREQWNKLFQSVPRFCVSMLVVMMALPVGHLFTGDFRVGGYFVSLVTAWPLVTVHHRI